MRKPGSVSLQSIQNWGGRLSPSCPHAKEDTCLTVILQCRIKCRTVKSVNAHVFLAGSLLGFNQSGSSLNTHNEASSYFGIQCSRMSCLFNSQNSFDPCHHLVGTWIRRFVNINESRFYIIRQLTFQGWGSIWQGGVVISANIEFIKIL